jgi:hypothetical protein
MAVNIQTTWADTTDIVVSTGPVRIKAVEVLRDPEATASVFIQMYNATSSTPGTTAITDQIEVPSAAATNQDGVHLKVNYSGKYYNTGLCIFCSSDRANTAPLTVEIPEYVKVYYV